MLTSAFKYMFWRKYPFQDALHASIVSLLCKTLHKSNVAPTDAMYRCFLKVWAQ